MFSSKKNSTNVLSNNIETVIGKTTTLNGTLVSEGAVRVEGTFQGEINAKGDVFVGAAGIVTANIAGKNVTIAGTVTGNVRVEDKLELVTGATLNGDIKVKRLVIEEGAVFKGTSETTNDKNIIYGLKEENI